MPKYQVLCPDYLKNFSCIGSACTDTCCAGWFVDIDEVTYKKYKKIKDPELSPLIAKCISRNRTGTNINRYARVKLLEDGSCPFLDENKLCRIQLKKGAEFLSWTCTSYPRIYNSINNIIEICTDLSCPESARLILLDKQPITFYMDEVVMPEPKILKLRENFRDIKYANSFKRHIWDIRDFCISIVQYREYSIFERLMVIGILIRKLSEIPPNNIPDMLLKFKERIERDEFKFDDFKANYNIQYSFASKLIKDLLYGGAAANNKYTTIVRKVFEIIADGKEASLEEEISNYESIYKNYFKDKEREIEYVFENVLVNYMFSTVFPFHNDEMFHSYLNVVLFYLLAKMQLIALSKEGLSDEVICHFFQNFSRVFEHSEVYLTNVIKMIKENNFDNMPYVSFLLKN